MPDAKVYIAKVAGDDAVYLYQSTDPRLVRKHILATMPPPEIEVRVPTIPEAMNAALDGVQIIDITGSPDTAPEEPKAQPTPQPQDDPGEDPPRLAPGEMIDPETGEIVNEEPF